MLIAHLTYILEQDADREGDRAAHLETQIASVQTRLTRLIDALLDGTLDKESFEMRKRLLFEEEQSLKDSLQAGSPDSVTFQARLTELFELACTAQQSYRLASPELKREMALRLTSNRTVAEKDVSVSPYFPLASIEQCSSIHRSGHQQHVVRTVKRAAEGLWEWARKEATREDGLADEAA